MEERLVAVHACGLVNSTLLLVYHSIAKTIKTVE